jgi:predicted NBD/HSP70 family sugar kinase
MKILNETLKKKMYKSQILNLLHINGALSQIAICKRLGLPKTTVSSIVTNAMKSGLIKKLGAEPGQRKVPGARPVLLGLDDTKSVVLGLSVRDGYFHSGLVNFYGALGNVKISKLDDFKWEELPGTIRQAVDEARTSGKNILGVGLAIGGYFKESNKSLAPESKYFDVPVGMPLIVDDYPNASAKAELLFGHAKEKDAFVFLQLGEEWQRVSCYSNGSIVRGTHGLAGEISLVRDFQQDAYRSPVRRYQHRKIAHFEDSSPSEIEEHSSHLANMILQIMVYYDPRQIIISGIPEEIWGKVNSIVDCIIKSHLDLDLYDLEYEIVRENQWKNKEIIYGASLIFEDILMRPRIGLKESVINF